MHRVARWRLRFLLTFAAADFTALAPARRQELRADLDDFLTREQPPVVGLVYGLRGQLDAEALRALQREVRTLIDAALTDPLGVRGDVWKPRDVVFARAVGVYVIVLGARVDDVVRKVAWYLLRPRKTGPARLRHCAECGSIFIRERRQRHCSPTCLNRATQRRWRHRHQKKENV